MGFISGRQFFSRDWRFLGQWARRLVRATGDLLWPPVCAVCPRSLALADDPNDPAGYFCPECFKTVEFFPQAICSVCGRPFFQGQSHVCGQCLVAPPAHGPTRSALVYQGAVARAVGALKYRGQLSQVGVLAALAGQTLRSQIVSEAGAGLLYDAIVPIPISARRLSQRGFNQALELAEAIYPTQWDLVRPGWLIRPGDSELHQAFLTGEERRKAIKGCFQVPDVGAVKGARILIFDDVLTTGSTVGEATRALLAAGAALVAVGTVARTVLKAWR